MADLVNEGGARTHQGSSAKIIAEKKGGWRTLKLKNEKIFDIDSTPLRIITDKITSHYSRFVCLFSEKKSVVERKQKIKKIITKIETQ